MDLNSVKESKKDPQLAKEADVSTNRATFFIAMGALLMLLPVSSGGFNLQPFSIASLPEAAAQDPDASCKKYWGKPCKDIPIPQPPRHHAPSHAAINKAAEKIVDECQQVGLNMHKCTKIVKEFRDCVSERKEIEPCLERALQKVPDKPKEICGNGRNDDGDRYVNDRDDPDCSNVGN